MTKFFYIPSDALLHTIQDMIEENKIYQKMNGNAESDMLEGRICSLKSLAVELGLCEWEDLSD